jgi:hypothetical protein
LVGASLLLASLLAASDIAEAPAFKPAAPRAPDGCRDGLKSSGMQFSPWDLRPSHLSVEILCEAPEGVAIKRGGAGLLFQPQARVNCAFAQRLVRFETVVQEEARRVLKSPVTSIVHLGTYNCRRMAAYPDWASEHSFANAIDVATFVLKNGRRVEVERDWVPPAKPALTPAAQFLRKLTRRLYDEKVFSVVLTPSFDAHHKNHLHLDGAPYNVDGTCSAPPKEVCPAPEPVPGARQGPK